MTCVFCAIAAGTEPATVVRRWPDRGVIAIRPRSGGVHPGHLLVIPEEHVADVGVDPLVSARVMQCAAELAAELPAANILTSRGSAATQSVFHLHVHVVPRAAGDGLALPWDPAPSTPAEVEVVWAREPLPLPGSGPAVFLAGPTPRRDDDVESWRPAAIDALTAQWAGPGTLTVLTPESRDGVRAEHYDDQVEWETTARARASAVLFWIPRDMTVMPGMTTNVEFGYDVASGRRVVLGIPPDCPNPERNRYLAYVAGCHGVPVRETLTATVQAALDLIPA